MVGNVLEIILFKKKSFRIVFLHLRKIILIEHVEDDTCSMFYI